MQARNIVEWLKSNYKVVFFWCIIIAVAPFFMEVLLVADVLGAEVAVGFLLLLYKELKNNWDLRVSQFKQQALFIYSIVQKQPICQSNIYLGHCVASIFFLAVGGTLTYSVFVWYPIVIFGNYLT